MSQAPAMPVFTDALIGDTTHLSAEEFGAYCLLLFAMWRSNGKPLPDDNRKLARICRVSTAKWRARLRPALIEFFTVVDQKLHQKRLEKTWDYVQENSQNHRDIANVRWLKNKETPHASAYATKTISNNKSNSYGGREVAASELPSEPWEARLRSWAKGRRWNDKDGPEPGQAGCRAPPDLAAAAIAQRSVKSIRANGAAA